MSPPNLIALNMIEEQHYHVDDRERAWQTVMLNNFRDKLVDPEPWVAFTQNPKVTTDELASTIPQKDAPIVTKEEFNTLFK